MDKTKLLLYFRVQPKTPLHKRLADWRRLYLDGYRKISQRVKEAYGVDAIIFGPGESRVIGLAVTKPIPQGWRVPRHLVSERARMVPIKGKEGREAQAFLDSLPRLPSAGEIALYIGCPSQYRWEGPRDDEYGSGAIGGPDGPASLGWAGNMLIVSVHNPEYYTRSIRESGATITAGFWTPPDALIPMSEVEMQYHRARHAFWLEKKAKRQQEKANAPT